MAAFREPPDVNSRTTPKGEGSVQHQPFRLSWRGHGTEGTAVAARRGAARLGRSKRGLSRRSWPCEAWPGRARLGGLGRTWRGTARQGAEWRSRAAPPDRRRNRTTEGPAPAGPFALVGRAWDRCRRPGYPRAHRPRLARLSALPWPRDGHPGRGECRRPCSASLSSTRRGGFRTRSSKKPHDVAEPMPAAAHRAMSGLGASQRP
jgi:hypothetical protein